MADLVNSTAKAQLSPRNSEPSHLKGVSYTFLGGPTPDGKGGDAEQVIDAAAGMSQDHSIPSSVPAEGSHLDTAKASNANDHKFSEPDEMDKKLDGFASLRTAGVKLSVKEEKEEDEDGKSGLFDDDKEKKDIKEEADEKEDEKEKEEVSEEKDAEEDEDEDEGEDKKKESVEEVLDIKIALPNASIFESAGVSAKSQKKFGIVLESVLKDLTKQITEQVKTHFQSLHESKIASYQKVMEQRVDHYLTYVVEDWYKENQVQINESLRVKRAESFLDGLQKLFVEHYVDVPAEKVSLVESLGTQVSDLTKQINELHSRNMELHQLATVLNKRRIVAEATRDMSQATADRMVELAEDVPYKSAQDFRERISVLHESYFGQQKEKNLNTLPEENIQPVITEHAKSAPASNDPMVNAAIEALARAKKSTEW